MSVRVRLVKVNVEAVFVLDDGTTITELPAQRSTIPAVDWPTYSAERFPRETAEWEASLNRPGV